VRSDLSKQLIKALGKIDRPGTFCASGSAPAVLPGLEVEELGPIGLPLTPKQAEELKQHCEQAPYGKGEDTLVDTSVRRVWRMTPDHFTLTNPEWQEFLQQTVRTIQEKLGLEKQKLEAHLYDLLLYEPGSFFLPHRDGEKLDRMVATLVVVLPSSFQGGELIVRHEGEEQTIDFSGAGPFHIHWAAFYADCEHEVRPLRKGYRLCLVYNLTLAKATKKSLAAPRTSEHVEAVRDILREWVEDEEARKLVITLDHQYTPDGLAWDALKGTDGVKARVLAEAARQAGCKAYLALLTFHESGSAVYSGGGYRRRGWYDDEEDAGDHEMDEVFESSVTLDHWSDSEGHRVKLEPLDVADDELLEPEALEAVEPEEEFEGYTGNVGMTLERWYRHAAIVLWPELAHFSVLCDDDGRKAVPALELLVKQWQRSRGEEAERLKAQCLEFADAIIAQWRPVSYGGYFGIESRPRNLLATLKRLDDPRLIGAYLGKVLAEDASVDPGKSLAAICRKYGWDTFRRELEAVVKGTTAGSLARNVRLLENLCLANPRKKEAWLELCGDLAPAVVAALEAIDRQAATDWQARSIDRTEVLAGLVRSLLATRQEELLGRVVEHVEAAPAEYPLIPVQVGVLSALRPWLKKNLEGPSPALAAWIAACCEQLEALTAQEPQKPTDFRRDATFSCKCADCSALKRFLEDPEERTYRFRAGQDRRQHVETTIRAGRCDVDCKTERRGSPHTLVCTKNTASYQARLKKYHADQKHLATLRAIEARLPE
jgi:hypothetical protein